MDVELIEMIIGFIGISVFCGILFGFIYLSTKQEQDYQLKKLGIIKPNNQIINFETNYKEKLFFEIKRCLIIVITVFLICLICKLFGFDIKDISDLF